MCHFSEFLNLTTSTLWLGQGIKKTVQVKRGEITPQVEDTSTVAKYTVT